MTTVDTIKTSKETLATPFGPFTFEVTSDGQATLVDFKESVIGLPVRRKFDTDQDEKDDGEFTFEKLSEFLGSWREMIKDGTVSDEVYEHRRSICAGVDGLNPPCTNNRISGDGVTHYCGGCGCGARKHAILYIDGAPASKSIRLHMPDPKCPLGVIGKMPGTGDLVNVGGRLAQSKALLGAAVEEITKKHKRTEAEAEKISNDLMRGD